MAEGASLRRYTDVLSLLDIIRHNRLTLLSPSRWFDQNDALGVKRYSEMRGSGSAYALCLAEGTEHAHHWQLFAGHSHGVCLVFDRDEFITFLDEAKKSASGFLLHGKVVYQNLKQVRERRPIPEEVLPFLKRDTFKAEEEYRVVAWQNEIFAAETYTLPMPASMIKRVVVGPTTPRLLAETLKDIAHDQPGCSQIPFAVSRLINNASWSGAIADGLGLDLIGEKL